MSHPADVPAPTPMGAVRGCWPTPEQTRMQSRLSAAIGAATRLEEMGALICLTRPRGDQTDVHRVWTAADLLDTGRVHGPALPTASQGWTDYGFGFNRYCGPWVSTSGFRLTDGPNPARRIPNDVDLYRPHLYR